MDPKVAVLGINTARALTLDEDELYAALDWLGDERDHNRIEPRRRTEVTPELQNLSALRCHHACWRRQPIMSEAASATPGNASMSSVPARSTLLDDV